MTLTDERATVDGIGWARVISRRAPNIVGWAATTHPSAVVPPAPPTPPPAASIRVTAPAGLRLRAGPALEYAIRQIVPLGTRLRDTGVRQAADGWAWA